MSDIQETIVAGFIEDMEQGVMPWETPWDRDTADCIPANAATGRPYSGVNVLLLWKAMRERRFSGNRWLTFRQARAVAGGVGKGERGTRIAFAKRFIPAAEKARIACGEITEAEARSRFCWKAYHVWNLDQIRDVPPTLREADGKADDSDVGKWIADTGAEIRVGGVEASYHSVHDYIVLPDLSRFESVDDYHQTALHELSHWTGHPTRLNRPFAGKDEIEVYAFEEMVAEISAAFLGHELGVTASQRSSDYLAFWLQGLKADARYLFRAAFFASAAAEYLRNAVADTRGILRLASPPAPDRRGRR